MTDRVGDAVIYDFETLGTEPTDSVVISVAILTFNTKRVKYGPDYSYDELLKRVRVLKFDVQDQVHQYKRKIYPDTLEWWGKQSKEAQKQLAPSSRDRSISKLPSFLADSAIWDTIKVVYTRNNTFDPPFMKYIHRDTGTTMPYAEWVVRDTKSTIDGMTWGQNIRDNFIVEGLEKQFIAHDPAHDIAMDVMRLQFLSRLLIDEIPF